MQAIARLSGEMRLVLRSSRRSEPQMGTGGMHLLENFEISNAVLSLVYGYFFKNPVSFKWKMGVFLLLRSHNFLMLFST